MSNDRVFINDGLTEMFKIYVRSKEQPQSVEYNGFGASVIRMLILIYGEDVLKFYASNDVDSFDRLLLKFGYEPSQLEAF